MPDLHEDPAALGVDRIGHPAPAFDLLGGVDAGRVLIALRGVGDLRRLGDDEAGAGALAVIFGHQRGGHEAGTGAVAGEGRHHDAVLQGDVAEAVGLEERGVGCCHAAILRGGLLRRGEEIGAAYHRRHSRAFAHTAAMQKCKLLPYGRIS